MTRCATTAVGEGSVGVWTDTTVQWSPWLRTVTGGRFDYYNASVNSLQSLLGAPVIATSEGLPVFLWTGPFNSNSKDASLFSPKASIIVGPFQKTELYLQLWRRFPFHRRARHRAELLGVGAFRHRRLPYGLRRIPLLVKSRGAEIGWRTKYHRRTRFEHELLLAQSRFREPVRGRQRHHGLSADRAAVTASNSPIIIGRSPGSASTATWRWCMRAIAASISCRRSPGSICTTPEALPYGTFLGNAPGNYLQNSVGITQWAALKSAKRQVGSAR